MCFKHVFARVNWPLNTGGELLNSSPLHPSQFSLASPWNRRVPGLSDSNHNYLPSDVGESVHFVISISPLDMKNAPRHQKREHYVGLMDLTGEAEFEMGLKSSLSCFRCSFSPALCLLIPSLPPYSLLYILPHSSLFLSPFIPYSTLSPCVSLPYRPFRVQMQLLCLCQQNRLFTVRVSFIRIREILLQCHRVTGREIEQLHIPFKAFGYYLEKFSSSKNTFSVES